MVGIRFVSVLVWDSSCGAIDSKELNVTLKQQLFNKKRLPAKKLPAAPKKKPIL